MAGEVEQGSWLNLGSCRLDLECGTVLRDGAAIPMRTKPLRVLRYLAENAV